MISKKSIKKSIRYDNSGSALIVCIIVLLFVSILATIILYVSGVNYRMKETDYRTRLSFYDSEVILERMQSNLVIPVSESINNSMLITNSFCAFQSGVPAAREFYYKNFDYEFKRLLLEQYGGATIGNSGAAISGSTLIKNILHNLTLKDITVNSTDGVAGIPLDHIICNDGSVLTNIADYSTNPMSFINDISQVDDGTGHNYLSQDGTYIVVTSFVGYSAPASPDPVWDNLNSFIELDVRDEFGSLKSDLDKCRVIFRNICVVTVKDGYKSVITTDLVVTIPPFDFTGGAEYGTWTPYQLMYYRNWQKS